MILLVGASVRALMESAVESGYEAMGIDFFGDADTRWQGKAMSVEKDYGLKPTVNNLLAIARTISCNGLVYTSGLENTSGELVYWEEQGSLLGNGTKTLQEVRNPWKLRKSLTKIQVKMPEFYGIDQWNQAKDGKRWLLKPLNRGGGHGILELPERKEDILALISGFTNPTQLIMEEYIEGIPGSVTFLANGRDGVALGTSRQLIGSRGRSRPFLYEGNIVPLDLKGVLDSAVFEKEVTRLIQHLVRNFELKGINTLDFIVNPEGLFILEINPRWSASVELIEKSLGKRLFLSHLATCEGRELIQIIQDLMPVYLSKIPDFWGKTIVYAPLSMVIKNSSEKKLRYLYEQGVRDLPLAGTRIEKGQPLCTVLATGATDEDCNLKLQAKADWVQNFYGQTIMAVAR